MEFELYIYKCLKNIGLSKFQIFQGIYLECQKKLRKKTPKSTPLGALVAACVCEGPTVN